MATITKTPAGAWKALIRKSGWPSAGKTFRTKRDAEDWARRTEDEMVRGVYIQRSQSERLTVAAALDRYLNEVTPTKKATTQKAELNKSNRLRDAFGGYSLAAVTPDLVADYRDKRIAEGKSNNTVRLELALLSHLFTTAIREWRVGLAYNPVANIRKPSPGEGRDRRLTTEECQRLLAAADAHSNPMFGWIVRLALYSGMRAGEIQNLKRNQVDLVKRTILLKDTKNGSARMVPLGKGATEVMRAALGNPIRPIDTDLIFFGEPGRDGKRRPYTITKLWATLRKREGFADLHFHDLRHEAVSRLVEAGLSDQEVSAISGHRSMQMLRKYTHLRSENLVEKLDRLSNS
jgi:integrase